MSKWILAAGAAAIALAAPSLAQGNGNKGGGNDKAQKADRGGGGNNKAQKASRGGGSDKQARGDRRGGGEMRMAQGNPNKGGDKARGNDRGKDRMVVRDRDDDRKGKDRGNDNVRMVDRDDRDDRARFGDRNDDRRLIRFDDDGRSVRFADNRWMDDGCPPGLAKKDNGCMPPGQAKKVGSVLPAFLSSQKLDGPFSQWYRDNDRYYFRNDGDYIYRVERQGGLIDALIPFSNRDYSYYPVGMNYPIGYDYYNVPQQYQGFYPEGGNFDYRYGSGAIYQVNPQNNAIQSIVALLAGDLAVGQRMPLSYGAYNVPLSYRDRYYDSPDAMYRYNDGYIYRADPTTQLITAVIDAIV